MAHHAPLLVVLVMSAGWLTLVHSKPAPRSRRSIGSSSGSGELVWGKKVDAAFAKKVVEISKKLKVNPQYLMSVMAFETGAKFTPDVRNAAGSSAVGLIQFMPSTAKGLGTTTAALLKMTAVEQLEYVYQHFKRFAGRLQKLEDVYMAVLFPRAVGKSLNYPLFKKPKRAYKQNKGLDKDKNGIVTKFEASEKVRAKMKDGLAYAKAFKGLTFPKVTKADYDPKPPPPAPTPAPRPRMNPMKPRPAAPLETHLGPPKLAVPKVSEKWTPALERCLIQGGGFECFTLHRVVAPEEKCRKLKELYVFACMEHIYMHKHKDIVNNPNHAAKGKANRKLPNAIYKATMKLKGTSSREGPDNGRNAAGWMVTRIMKEAGIAPVGKNTNSVPSIIRGLEAGRGKKLRKQSHARKGDLVVSKGQAHIGVCMSKGCKAVLSNSFPERSLVWYSDARFGGYFESYPGIPQFWRVRTK